MEIQIAENIKKFRKDRGLTQEQLAEALHVTVGAVYKWESRQSMPEIKLLVEIAEFFQTSIDVLLGYQLQDSGRKQILDELKGYIHDRGTLVPFDTVEKYIRRFPNDFEVVYRAGRLYAMRGLTERKHKMLHRALELLQQTCHLLEQNTDEKISLLSLQIEIAGLYRSLERNEEALTLYLEHNPCGINDGQIGILLATSLNRSKEAIPYLSNALMHHVFGLMEIVMGYMNAYDGQKRYKEMLQIIDWAIHMADQCRLPGQISPLDSLIAVYMAAKAYVYVITGQREAAKGALEQARDLALRFDARPCYDAGNICFVELEEATVYDDYGDSAMDGIDRYIRQEHVEELSCLWEEVCLQNE